MPDYADLTEAEQVALIEQTDNSLRDEDLAVAQDEHGPDLDDPEVEVVNRL